MSAVPFELEIHDATRTKRNARIGVFGPSSSGKTYTSLILARAIANAVTGKEDQPFVVIDAEAGRVELYADLADFKPFKVIPVKPPFSPDHYIAAVHFAEKAIDSLGLAPVCVIDTISPEWAGEGGVQTIVDEATARMGGNKWGAWAVATPAHNRFVDTMLQSPLHIICNMRSKTKWALDDKNRPRKVGLEPVQREELEYEFDLVLRMDMTNTAEVTKTFLPELTLGLNIEKPGASLAEPIIAWLQTGADHGAEPDGYSVQRREGQTVAAPVEGEPGEEQPAETAAKTNGGEKVKPATKGTITKLINDLDSAHPDYEHLTWADSEGTDPIKHEWGDLAEARSQQWFEATLGDLNEEQAQTLIERLRHTKELLDKAKAEAAPETL